MNLAAVSSIFVFISNFIIGLLVLWRGKNVRIKISWFLFCVTICVWGLGSYKVFTSASSEDALYWWKIGNLGIIFTPVTYYNFIYVFCGLKKKYEKYILIAAYTLSFVVVAFGTIFPRQIYGELRWVFGQYFQVDWLSYKSPLYLISYIILYWVLLFYTFFV